MDNLKILKLITGEEIVGKITYQSIDTTEIENPCQLGIGMSPTGKATLQMQPMLIFSEQKTVEIKNIHVLYATTVAIEIQNKYNEIYGSGITIAKSSIIT
jgi:hypothetical protein